MGGASPYEYWWGRAPTQWLQITLYCPHWKWHTMRLVGVWGLQSSQFTHKGEIKTIQHKITETFFYFRNSWLISSNDCSRQCTYAFGYACLWIELHAFCFTDIYNKQSYPKFLTFYLFGNHGHGALWLPICSALEKKHLLTYLLSSSSYLYFMAISSMNVFVSDGQIQIMIWFKSWWWWFDLSTKDLIWNCLLYTSPSPRD